MKNTQQVVVNGRETFSRDFKYLKQPEQHLSHYRSQITRISSF